METAPREYRVLARNPATGSENRIHADDVASRYGFRGGLVPGVIVYAWLADALYDALGPAWVAEGRAAVRFRQPCYEGDELRITLLPTGPVSVGIEATVGDTSCVTGAASVGLHDPALPLGPYPGGPVAGTPIPGVGPPRPLPTDRPPVSRAVLRPGAELAVIPLDTSPAAVAEYELRAGRPAPPGLAERGWLPPAMLLEGANWILTASVVMPLWLHVGSEIVHRRPVGLGEPITVRARVGQEWEQRGHRYVTLQVAWTVGAGPDAEVVAAAAHTAIWRLAGT